MSWCWRRSQQEAELLIKETHSLSKSMFASNTVIARLWLTFSHGIIISTIACSPFFVEDGSVCVTFFSLYWLITHLVEYNVSISGTALSLVLPSGMLERIFSYSKNLSVHTIQLNSFGTEGRERTMGAGTPGSFKDAAEVMRISGIWMSYVGLLRKCFHLIIRMNVWWKPGFQIQNILLIAAQKYPFGFIHTYSCWYPKGVCFLFLRSPV